MALFKSGSKQSHRASAMKQQRDKDRLELDKKRKKLESTISIDELCPKFTARQDVNVTSDTIGLVTLEELKAQQEAAAAAKEKQLSAEKMEASAAKPVSVEDVEEEIERGPVSFACQDEDDDEDDDHCEVVTPAKKRRYGVNPRVDPRAVPDVYREEEEARLRSQLRQEWLERREAAAQQPLTLSYAYWDGSGHRRTVTVRRGDSVAVFLTRCLDQLRREFAEVRTAAADRLMYVRDDLIVPHHATFLEMAVSGARGKTGPLFSLDDAGNGPADDDSKVCLRGWYDRNKHIFPASRWEPYDPDKDWDRLSAIDKQAAKIVVK